MSRKKSPQLGIFLKVGERIKQIRGNLTQIEFAKIFNVGGNTVSRWEKGRLSDEETLKKIATYGEVTLEWLLKGEGSISAAQEGSSDFARPLPGVPGPETPYLFAAVDTTILAQIIALVEMELHKKKRVLKPISKAHLLSLLYDRYQETGKPPDKNTIQEFLRLV